MKTKYNINNKFFVCLFCFYCPYKKRTAGPEGPGAPTSPSLPGAPYKRSFKITQVYIDYKCQIVWKTLYVSKIFQVHTFFKYKIFFFFFFFF